MDKNQSTQFSTVMWIRKQPVILRARPIISFSLNEMIGWATCLPISPPVCTLPEHTLCITGDSHKLLTIAMFIVYIHVPNDNFGGVTLEGGLKGRTVSVVDLETFLLYLGTLAAVIRNEFLGWFF